MSTAPKLRGRKSGTQKKGDIKTEQTTKHLKMILQIYRRQRLFWFVKYTKILMLRKKTKPAMNVNKVQASKQVIHPRNTLTLGKFRCSRREI